MGATFHNMDLRVRDMDRLMLGQMEKASGRFSQSSDGLAVELKGSGEGLGLPGDIETKLSVPASYMSLDLDLEVENWSVGDLAERFSLGDKLMNGFPADI